MVGALARAIEIGSVVGNQGVIRVGRREHLFCVRGHQRAPEVSLCWVIIIGRHDVVMLITASAAFSNVWHAGMMLHDVTVTLSTCILHVGHAVMKSTYELEHLQCMSCCGSYELQL